MSQSSCWLIYTLYSVNTPQQVRHTITGYNLHLSLNILQLYLAQTRGQTICWNRGAVWANAYTLFHNIYYPTRDLQGGQSLYSTLPIGTVIVQSWYWSGFTHYFKTGSAPQMLLGGDMQNWIRPVFAFSTLVTPSAACDAFKSNTSPSTSSVSSTVPCEPLIKCQEHHHLLLTLV